MAEAAQETPEISVDYKIRRRTKSGLDELPVSNVTLLTPGDVVFVSLGKSTTPNTLQQ